ncbi:MAG: ornithine carbamoyltransferase, partial [Candidatus Margulisbacteria bacterium]|nr:ornithine carbamoyltransferase [Candidatus Margulisiibacteriota bacterium]
MKKRDFLSLVDLSAKEINSILELSQKLKKEKKNKKILEGKAFGLIFEKPSTRTYVSFDIAINDLGGHSVTLPVTSLG